MNLVFVYGTLKRGYGNHRLLQSSKFVGEGQTIARCRLFNSGFPVLRHRLRRDGPWNAPVRGEVFLVNDAETMRRLDMLEGEGRMYHRRRKRIRLDKTGKVVTAFVYVGDARAFSGYDIYPAPCGAYEWSRL